MKKYKNTTPEKNDEAMKDIWDQTLIDAELPDLDISEGFGRRVDDVLNGQYYHVDEIKSQISTKTNQTQYDNGLYNLTSYIYKGIPIAEIDYMITKDKAYIEKIMTSNSDKENKLRLEDTRKNLRGRKLSIDGLGTYVLDDFISKMQAIGVKHVSLVYTVESEGFYKKILPKLTQKYNANFKMTSKTCVITFN